MISPCIISAYLRDGRVHENREAYEGGDGLADYRYEIAPSGASSIVVQLNGRRFRSLWAWPPTTDKPFGYISLKEEKS